MTLRHVSFSPHRTSVFPLIVVPPVLQTMLLLAEGRAGEVWESTNKECHVGYRGALDAEVLSHCSVFPVSVSACYLLVSSSSPVPVYHSNIPFSACHPYLCFTDTSCGHCTCCVARLLCISTKVSASSAGQHSTSIIRGTSELTRGELPATRAKQGLCIFALSFHLLPWSPESATTLIQPWPSGSILLSCCKVSDFGRCVVGGLRRGMLAS